jgi:catechol 2,3-dioxygenase-like lactoylglutathione lyase family enzyme
VITFDHTSFAVPDAVATARRVRRELGAVPFAGEAMSEFRWLQLRVGDDGQSVELLDPAGPGFLSRFLDRRGSGPHHVTFLVPDLRAAVADARAVGAVVVGEDYGHPAWREAFLAPDGVHGLVIQHAETDGSDDFVADWWQPVTAEEPLRVATLGHTHLTTTDPGRSEEIFASLLGGEQEQRSDGVRYTWPGGALLVRRGDVPGITGLTLDQWPGAAPPVTDLLPGVAWTLADEPGAMDTAR